MMQDIQVNNDRANITLRRSLLNFFQDKVFEEMDALNCHYFAHNLIKHYDKTGYTISAFCTHPEWQQEYWQNHWDSDILASKIHGIAETDGFSITSWDVVDPVSDLMKRRKAICHIDDGVYFTFKHNDELLENYSFGWKKNGWGQMGFEKLLKLSDVVSDFRNAHLKLVSAPTQ
ncbi:MAG: hypothetical protein ACOH2E_00565 [Candidatus Paracaedibacter sp.]